MPMQRWIASAAGGTSHRLKLGLAMVRSRDKNPTGTVAAIVSPMFLLSLIYSFWTSLKTYCAVQHKQQDIGSRCSKGSPAFIAKCFRLGLGGGKEHREKANGYSSFPDGS